MSRAWLLPVVALLGGCGPQPDDSDPLDPDGLASLGKADGDAHGDQWSGTYATALELLECDCPAFEVEGETADLCRDEWLTSLDDDVPMTVLQADGRLMFQLEDDVRLSGPVDADGSFLVAGLRNETNAYAKLTLLARIDGQFAGSRGSRSFDGTYLQRFMGSIADEQVDCRFAHAVQGTELDEATPE